MPRRGSVDITTADLLAGDWLYGDAKRQVPPAQWLRIAKSLHLTPRELQIVVGVYNDEKNSAIAYRLGISQHTVRSHLRRLHTKLGVSSRTAILARVIDALLSADTQAAAVKR